MPVLELGVTVPEILALNTIMKNEGVDLRNRREVSEWILGQCGVETEALGGGA